MHTTGPMHINGKVLTLALGMALTLVACGGNDVPPANNSSAVLQPDPNDAVPTSDVAGAGNQPGNNSAAAEVGSRSTANGGFAVTEADVTPAEYLRSGSSDPAALAYATLQPTEGNNVNGMVAIIQPDASDTVRITGKIVHLTPGAHGFHIHENGDCTTPDASSAGEHFNPDGMSHGDRSASVRHVGDMGNIVADAEGTATFDFMDMQAMFNGANSVIGKAFIVHSLPDDLMTQPSGNAGQRLACGVITTKQSQSVLAPQ